MIEGQTLDRMICVSSGIALCLAMAFLSRIDKSSFPGSEAQSYFYHK